MLGGNVPSKFFLHAFFPFKHAIVTQFNVECKTLGENEIILILQYNELLVLQKSSILVILLQS